ncbi:uncharacterized protein LOC127804783 [Diospyros lotus]|uniref:uncharacterized protein LOC127804783 n=1 Tax=Diospyros lotus TaxID=55363 RepID=UPI002252BBA6|nr:uncharacterized protein LOC127804783 [Diospyros lotus]XP_052197756.1 uncharacterized protein LOC127804783 [Diospyros lotus]XP_052197757.1 uncharacterized protein LOC127804783 [Diospyros lotus]
MARFVYGSTEETAIDRIMLRFRPIAPKPAPDGSKPGHLTTEIGKRPSVNGRTKRKYVRVTKNKQCKTNNTQLTRGEPKKRQKKRVVTQRLLPERPGGEDLSAGGSCRGLDRTSGGGGIEHSFFWLSFEDYRSTDLAASGESESAVVKALPTPDRVVIESWVTMACLTVICMDTEAGGGERLGLTDFDILKNLEEDTCPGFVSDSVNLVRWVNGAFKKMMWQGDHERRSATEYRVWLVIKERIPVLLPGFGCMVRLQYNSRVEQRKYSMTVPCDVWRMDSGGFAWRLDVRAALSLGI